MHGVPLCEQTRRRLQAIFPVRLLSLVTVVAFGGDGSADHA